MHYRSAKVLVVIVRQSHTRRPYSLAHDYVRVAMGLPLGLHRRKGYSWRGRLRAKKINVGTRRARTYRLASDCSPEVHAPISPSIAAAGR